MKQQIVRPSSCQGTLRRSQCRWKPWSPACQSKYWYRSCLWMSLSSESSVFNTIPRYLYWSKDFTYWPPNFNNGVAVLFALLASNVIQTVLLQLKIIPCDFAYAWHTCFLTTCSSVFIHALMRYFLCIPWNIVRNSKRVGGMRMTRCSEKSYAGSFQIFYSTYSQPHHWMAVRNARGNLVNCTFFPFTIFIICQIHRQLILTNLKCAQSCKTVAKHMKTSRKVYGFKYF